MKKLDKFTRTMHSTDLANNYLMFMSVTCSIVFKEEFDPEPGYSPYIVFWLALSSDNKENNTRK